MLDSVAHRARGAVSEAIAVPDWIRCDGARDDWRQVVARLGLRAQADTSVPEPCRVLLAASGQCLRPALLLLCVRFGAPSGIDVPRLAEAVELLHLASLFHDDVVDDAPVRRGRCTPAYRWGPAAAVYGGGYLMAESMAEFAAADAGVARLAADALERLCRGEMEERFAAGDPRLPLRRHVRIVRNKTGALFVLPCLIAARIGGLDAMHTRRVERFGARVGVAYQLLDDLRDLLAVETATGKLAGMDLREGVFTLAILHGARSPCARGKRLVRLLAEIEGPTSLAEIRTILASTGSIDFARGAAGNCLRAARAEAMYLPAGTARDSLLALVEVLSDALGGLP